MVVATVVFFPQAEEHYSVTHQDKQRLMERLVWGRQSPDKRGSCVEVGLSIWRLQLVMAGQGRVKVFGNSCFQSLVS